MRILKEYLNKDRPVAEGEICGFTESLEVETRRGRVQGYLVTPNHKKGELHPAILMLHGFPGIANNHDLAQILRNIGFVVFVPNAPGSWGSDGSYSFDGLVEAAHDVADYIRRAEICERLSIDSGRLFVIGHSMGGFAAVNLLRVDEQIRGAAFIAPCDFDWFFRSGEMAFIDGLNEASGRFIKTNLDLKENAARIHEDFSFRKAYPKLSGKNFLLLQCKKDQIIPMEMLSEFREQIESGGFAPGIQDYRLLDTNHVFDDCKYTVAETIADFFSSLC